MSDYNRDDYFDLDNFDDSRDYRRRQPDRRQSSYNGKPVYRSSVSRKRRKAQRMRRIRNRAIIIGSGVLILALIILLFTLAVRSCSKGGGDGENISTDTISQQGGTTPSTPDEATNASNAGGDLSPSFFKTPVISDDNTDGYLSYAIYVWHNTGYELFGGSEERSRIYADTINSLADKLTGIDVYDMIVPNHTEYGLPQRLKDGDAPSTSQAESIKNAYSALSSKVTPINPYNYLADHNSEYIYFKSDHHWTGLGAYYAYKAFADTNNLPALSLSDCTEQKIEGFTGTFSNTAAGLDTDEVHYWEFPYTVSMDITYGDGTVETYDSPYYDNATEGTLTYGVFIFGDNPLTVMKSYAPDAREGKKIAIVKESYGNALVPYFTNNYEEVHVIDFRYFRDTVGTDFESYCRENDITDVLFVNGVMSANTQIQLDSISGMFE